MQNTGSQTFNFNAESSLLSDLEAIFDFAQKLVSKKTFSLKKIRRNSLEKISRFSSIPVFHHATPSFETPAICSGAVLEDLFPPLEKLLEMAINAGNFLQECRALSSCKSANVSMHSRSRGEGRLALARGYRLINVEDMSWCGGSGPIL